MKTTMRKRGFILGVISILFGAFFLFPITAQALKSNNFQFDETSIGTSGPLNQSSTNYGLSGATGDIGVGNSASENFQIDAGSKTDPDPVLAFAVENTEASFGVLSSTTPATTTAKFNGCSHLSPSVYKSSSTIGVMVVKRLSIFNCNCSKVSFLSNTTHPILSTV